ncbi:MAG: DUF3375 domain-containing protein [Chloroflexota bacterium]
MNHDRLQTEFKHSVTFKLLQSSNAPLILSFLYDQFKQKHRNTISHSELSERLEDYVTLLQTQEPTLYSSKADTYLRIWCDEKHRFLRRYHEANSDDAVYELTPDTERAIRWVEELQKGEFVGTESRFLRIFSLLRDIITYGNTDVETRLGQLEAEKARIQAEIDELKTTGQAETYTTTQVKERFFEANDVLRRLLADFREIEENFRNIARQVQKQQLQAGMKKGSIVKQVLDADSMLKESDQGRSFYAFWDFLISPTKQEELRALLNAIQDLEQLNDVWEETPLLRRMKRSLLDAGAKIIESNRKLGEQLRRLLDEQRLAEARRVMELASEVKQLAIKLNDNPPRISDFIEIDSPPDVDLPLQWKLWSRPEKPDFERTKLDIGTIDLTQVDLKQLYNQFYVEEGLLRRQVETLLQHQHQVTLSEVIARYPISKGLSELLTYFALASRAEFHKIDVTKQTQLQLNERTIIVPEVIFTRG